MAQIGLRKFGYAVMETEDTDTSAAVYDTPKLIPGLISVGLNVTYQEATLYADDIIYAQEKVFEKAEVTVDMADLPLEDRAILFGHTRGEDGVEKSSSDDSPPYIAIFFESKKHNGEIRYVKLLKGKFNEDSEDLNTKGGNTEYQTHKITATFIARKNDHNWRYIADAAASDTTISTTWYESVEVEVDDEGEGGGDNP